MRDRLPDQTPAPLEPLPRPVPLAPLRPWKTFPKHIRKRLRGRTVMAVETGETDGARSVTVTSRAGDGVPKTETFTLEGGK